MPPYPDTLHAEAGQQQDHSPSGTLTTQQQQDADDIAKALGRLLQNQQAVQDAVIENGERGFRRHSDGSPLTDGELEERIKKTNPEWKSQNQWAKEALAQVRAERERGSQSAEAIGDGSRPTSDPVTGKQSQSRDDLVNDLVKAFGRLLQNPEAMRDSMVENGERDFRRHSDGSRLTDEELEKQITSRDPKWKSQYQWAKEELAQVRAEREKGVQQSAGTLGEEQRQFANSNLVTGNGNFSLPPLEEMQKIAGNMPKLPEISSYKADKNAPPLGLKDFSPNATASAARSITGPSVI